MTKIIHLYCQSNCSWAAHKKCIYVLTERKSIIIIYKSIKQVVQNELIMKIKIEQNFSNLLRIDVGDQRCFDATRNIDSTLIRCQFAIWVTLSHTHSHTHTHTLTHNSFSHTLTHTHTLAHVGFPCFMGTFHRRNGFYTVQSVCAIALHLPYT